MADKTVHWLENHHHQAKAATMTGKHPETRVKEESPNVVIRKHTSGTEGKFPEVEVCHQGEDKHRLGSQRQHKYL